MDAESQLLAENERLTAYEAVIIEAYETKLRRKDKLIIELCDALEWYVPLSLTPRNRELLQSARDATR